MVTNPNSTEQPEWMSALSRFLIEESQVEAIRVFPEREEVSLATLGIVDATALQERLSATLQEVESLPEFLAKNVIFRESGGEYTLSKPTCATAPTFWHWRKIPWIEELDPEVSETAGSAEEEDWRLLGVLAGLCGLLGVTAFMVETLGSGPSWLIHGLYIGAMAAGGWDAAKDVRIHLPRGKLDIHFLMLAVAVGASAIGAWTEGALLLFLFSLSGALEHFALYRTRREVASLFNAAPRQARLIDSDGGVREVPVDSITAGMKIRILPGDVFPLDSEILEGESAADESNLTGEATPVSKGKGDTVFSGTLNLWGSVQAQVLRPARQSALQKIIRLIKEAQRQKAPSQSFTDKFGTHYTVGILVLTTLMFFVWWLGLGVRPFHNAEDSTSAFYRAMTLLVVASPCALVLSIPSAILAAIAWGARNGILFRGGVAIEKLAESRLVALDKTGTLTTGEMVVERVESFPPGQEGKIAEAAVALEAQANHPIARAVLRYGKQEGIPVKPVERFKSLTGKGIQGEHGGGRCVLGRRELIEMGPLKEWIQEVPHPDPEYTEVWVLQESLMGRLLLRDEIRTRSRGVLAAMHRAGLRTVMLTGDRRMAAERVAEDLGLDEVEAGLSPEAKVEFIKAWNREGLKPAMVGDGVNDAPSLAAAYVAVAMGARGSDAALEQSDVVLMNDRIENFMEAYALSRRSRAVIRQNIAIALGTVILMVGASLFGLVPLSVGVFAHEGSTVLVCLNSLRLLFKRPELEF